MAIRFDHIGVFQWHCSARVPLEQSFNSVSATRGYQLRQVAKPQSNWVSATEFNSVSGCWTRFQWNADSATSRKWVSATRWRPHSTGSGCWIRIKGSATRRHFRLLNPTCNKTNPIRVQQPKTSRSCWNRFLTKAIQIRFCNQTSFQVAEPDFIQNNPNQVLQPGVNSGCWTRLVTKPIQFGFSKQKLLEVAEPDC